MIAPSARRHRWVWAGASLLLLAALLRVWGLAYGQPNPAYLPSTAQKGLLHEQAYIHPDEYFYVAIPAQMLLEGRANPQFFENPSFLIYLNALTFGLTGETERLPRDEVALRSLAPFRLYVVGRAYSAMGGLLAVAATVAVGRMLAGRFAGLVAGGVVAVSFPMVQHAHYATTSSLASGFVALCLWASYAALKGRPARAGMLVWAGIFAGLAAGNRYNAAAVALVVFVAGLVLLRRHPTRRTLLYVCLGWGAFPLAFVATSPYVVLDFPRFWADFSMIAARFSGIDAASYAPWNGLWLEYRYIIVFGLGAPAALMALWGAWRGRRLSDAWVLWCYILPYSVVVLWTAVPHIGDQLTVPIIPALAIFAGVGAVSIARVVGRVPLLLGALVVPLSLSLMMVSLLSQTDTRDVAALWINEHVPQGARIHLLGPYNVALDGARYRVQQTFAGSMPSLARLRELGVAYLVVSDAWPFFDNRKWEYVPETARQAMNDYFATIAEELTLLYEVARPVWPGYDWLTNNASYWHHPAIRVYCLTDAACHVGE